MLAFLPFPLNKTIPVSLSVIVRLICEVMLSSIRPSINPFTGDARGVEGSMGAVTLIM